MGEHEYAIKAVGVRGRRTPASRPTKAGGRATLRWDSDAGADAYVILRDGQEVAGPLRIIEVTNLEHSGDGSLRRGMEASGPRICVFRVSGTITLKSAIRVSTPYLTVAGQTSPGGVQIIGDGQPEGDWGVWFVNGAHDIVVRHLRVRMGGNMKHDAGNNLLCYGTAEPGVHDVIFDHCSVSSGSDTQLDWYGSYLDRATFQWNLNDLDIPSPTADDDGLLRVDEALERFSGLDPRKAELVKLRYFVGLSFEETATALGIAVPTAKQWWAYARAWLSVELRGGDKLS